MCPDTFKPFFYENQFFVIRAYWKDAQDCWYVGLKNAVTVLDGACQFSSVDEAKRALARLPKKGFLYEIEAITQNIGPISPVPEFVVDLMEKVPFPYFFVAYEWYCGGDVKSWLLTYRSKSTYYRYRNKLIEYDIDISRPSQVVLIGEKSFC